MNSTKLDPILSNAACRGAYRVEGDAIVALKSGDASTQDAATRTRDMWASLSSFVPDISTVIAKRGSDMSIASNKGGLIVEASGPMNIGFLRAALQDEESPRLEAQSIEDTITSPGARALWRLATWIAEIEDSRAIVVTAGNANVRIWARKGRFGLEKGMSPTDIANQFRAAGRKGEEIAMTYDNWPKTSPEVSYDPVAFFETATGKTAEWVFESDGTPASSPSNASLRSAGLAIAFRDQLLAWGDGQACEIAVLRGSAIREVVAESNPKSQLRIVTEGWS